MPDFANDAAPTRPQDHTAIDAWERAAAKSAPGGSVDALNWRTPEGIVVKPLYTEADLAGLAHTDTLPGFAPFLRGPQATMYAVRPWTIRQYAGRTSDVARRPSSSSARTGPTNAPPSTPPTSS